MKNGLSLKGENKTKQEILLSFFTIYLLTFKTYFFMYNKLDGTTQTNTKTKKKTHKITIKLL